MKIAAQLLLGIAAALTLAVAAGGAAAQISPLCPSAVAGSTDLGRLAFVDGRQLRVLTLATCQIQTLVNSDVEPPLRWSADGRYLAYGSGSVVAAAGGPAIHPLGRLAVGWGGGSPGWAWAPSGHRLAGVTSGGGVVAGAPGARPQRLLPDGWGASSIAWSPNGRTLAVSRSLYPRAPAPYHQEIWLLDSSTGARTLLWHLPKPELAPAWLSGFSPDGRWLLTWEDTQNSSSLAADGVPLALIPTNGGRSVILGSELIYGDFVSWCGPQSLAYVRDSGGRQVTLNDRINLAGPPPNWPSVTPADPGRQAHLSFVSPACSPMGGNTIAAAAGPASQDLPFGHEHRAIWLMSAGGRWLPIEAPPPRGSSDELPMWSSDGHWIAFIRTTWKASGSIGRLYLLELGGHFNGHARRVGPVANLGASGDYYGHYGWGGQVAWYSR